MKRGIRSYFLALRASDRFGRATKLRKIGKTEDALKVAREALAILSHPMSFASTLLRARFYLVQRCWSKNSLTSWAYLAPPHRDIVDALRILRAVGAPRPLPTGFPI